MLVYASDDRAAVRASLLLMADRYSDDAITVTGNRKFQRLVLEIANQEGVTLGGALGRQQVRKLADQASRADTLGHISHIAAVRQLKADADATLERDRPDNATPHILAWRKACAEETSVIERQQLAHQAWMELQRAAVAIGENDEMARLRVDAQLHQARMAARPGFGRGRG